MACFGLCLLVSAWLTENHYDAPHRDAVLTYIRHESDFQPNLIERTGVCLAQWAGSRRRDVLAQGRGRCPPWQDQLERMDFELRNEPMYRCFWAAHTYAAAVSAIKRGFGQGKC